MIGNTHFDPVWLWKWDEAMASIRATFRSALDRMNEDDGFVYSFVTPPVFEWIKRVEPDMFEEIKARVAEGRWDIAEGWWLQPDCYSANGESYIRQGLYGQRYLKENFGKTSEVVFNIDSFGHSPMLPQILEKCGIKYYCFVRPEKHHVTLENPYFRWEGIDKSSLLAYRAETAYEKDVVDTAQKLGELYEGNVMIVYGVTDHGGAPTKKSIADINSRDDMKFSTVRGFFEASGEPDSVVKGELLTGDFGPYANGTRIKQLNLLAENAVLNAEKSAVIANRNEKDALTECWKDIMFNQFHDILGGASIRQAYYDAKNLYGRAITNAEYIMHTNLQLVTSKICMPGKNPDNPWNLVVWNLNGTTYDGYIEAEVQWLHEFDAYNKSIALEDADGISYACQLIRERSVIPGFRSRFVFKAQIPAMGYKAFKVICEGREAEFINNRGLNPYEVETKLFKIKLSKENGSVISVQNKRTGVCMNAGMFVPACYADAGDTWCFNIDEYGDKLGEFKGISAKVVENGIHRTKIKITSQYGRSVLYMYYTFYDEEMYFDVAYRVNWNEKYTAFKLDFHVANEGVNVGVPAGKVFRRNQKGDVPLNRWMSFGDISIITPSAFAYSATDKKVGITVLRSPIYGDLRLEKINLDEDYEIMQQGITEGTIRILFDGDAEREADNFCNECIVIDESNHGGELEGVGNYLELEAEHVQLMAVKHGEDDGIIVRIRESAGKVQSGILRYEGCEYHFVIDAYEIKTFKIKTPELSEVNMLEIQS